MYSDLLSADSKYSLAKKKNSVRILASADSSSTAATASKLSSAENSEDDADNSTVKEDSVKILVSADSFATAATSSKFSSAENSEKNADKSTVKAESVKILESAETSSKASTGDRLVFLCYRGSKSDQMPKLLSAAFNARQESMPIKTRLIICKELHRSELSHGNVLILPERIKYRNLKESDMDSFVEHVLVHNQPLPSGIEEMMPGYHILVCADGSGTAVRDKFIEEAEMRGLTVNPCSQTGGDKYKGSIIVYTAGPDGTITGRWYGEVSPEDVEDLFNECFGFAVMNKEIREQLLRSMRSEDDAPHEDDSP